VGQLVANAQGARPRLASLDSRSPLAAQVLAEMQRVRLEHGLPSLRTSPDLRASAESHSLDMADSGYFAHDSADGTPFWKRVERFYPAAGYRSWDAAETLLWSSPAVDAASAVAGWLASPRHRAILLSPKWREVGVATVHESDAPGVFDGLDVTIVTADYGTRVR
jgi:uncharacterized protein YkwD